MSKKYWIKLDEHFFEQDEIIYLDSRPNGDKYIKIWLKLLLKCLKSDGDEGILRFNEFVPYDEDLLAQVLREDIDHIKAAFREFLKMKMIEVLEDGTIYIETVQRLIGKESDSAERVRRFREKKKQLSLPETECNSGNVTVTDNIEVEEEIEVKKNKKKDYSEFCKIIVDYFNSITGKRIQHNESNYLLITEALKKKYTVDQIKAVFSLKNKEWNNDRMRKNIRLSTLCRPSNLKRYVTEIEDVEAGASSASYGLDQKEKEQEAF